VQRTTAFKALVGSANYHLATPESDKDYKVFVLPSFDDLYHGKVFTESKVGIVDEEFHDIRKLVRLLWKSNVNFVEVLFSDEVMVSEVKWIKEAIEEIFVIKNKIAAMNLPYLYKACKGMFLSKSKYIDQGNEATRTFVEKFGYDTKSAMHAYRIIDFIERYANHTFTDFKEAIHYDDTEREFMLSIKHGALTKAKYDKLVADKIKIFEHLETVYLAQSEDEKTKKHLEKILYSLLSKHVLNELQK
jgi:predicted nucleotidyltransferase